MNNTVSKELAQLIYLEEVEKAISAYIPIPQENMPKKIKFSKSRSQFGCCRYNYNYTKDVKDNIEIVISEYHLANGVQAVRETIMHEICHCAKGKGHDTYWKKLVNVVNKRYGYNISRLGSSQAGCMLVSNKSNCYQVQCTCCKKIIERTKYSKVIQHPEFFRCAVCKGSLVRIK